MDSAKGTTTLSKCSSPCSWKFLKMPLLKHCGGEACRRQSSLLNNNNIGMQRSSPLIMFAFLLLLGGGQVSIIWKCFPCDFIRANELFTNKCLQKADHKGADMQQQLVCRSSRRNKLVAINPLPRNKERMQECNERYAFKHSKANCKMPHGRCTFPHSHIEAEAWNTLLYCHTPQQKVGAIVN